MNGRDAIREVAKRSGTNRQDVYQKILDGMKMAQEIDDPEIKRIWASIPRKGKEITPEELIEYIAGQVKSNLQKDTNGVSDDGASKFSRV